MLRVEVNSLKDKYAEIDTSINVKAQSVKAFLEKETGERGKAVNMLKKEINEKENQIKDVSKFNQFVYMLSLLNCCEHRIV